jgi:hypothetical protein
LPTVANPGFGYDALYALGYGIDSALPATQKADFTPVVGAPTLLNTSFDYNVTSTNDNVTRAATAQVTHLNNFGAERRPVVVLMPGWGGVGDVVAAQDAQAIMFANQGYVAVNVGFHQTNDVSTGPPGALTSWYSDLSESVKAALDAMCLQTYADCSAVVVTGESYGGTQIHPVVRFLRANNVFDGSGGVNVGRKVVGLLGQDSGYTLYWSAPVDADATAYSIALIQNLGDTTFPTDTCDFGNCGARNRADYHQTAAGSQYVLSYCPAGGQHGTRGYANWDSWVLSAVKTMLHNHRGVPKFTGYSEPNVAVSNSCLTNPIATSQTIGPISFSASTLRIGGAVTISATATSSLPVGFDSSTPSICTVNGSTITGVGAGSCSITASQPGDASHLAAAPVTQSIIVAATNLSNISTRGPSLTGSNVMIGGFIISGSTPKTVLIRARGPSMSAFGVPGVLVNPMLDLYSGQTVIAKNDDWASPLTVAGGNPPASQTAIQATGLAPTDSREAAILITLAPGPYTAIVTGASNSTGVAIVEVLEIDHPESPLSNISTRGPVQTGNNVMIGGFIISGSTPQTVLIRARGPSMSAFGVAGVLADPVLNLYQGQNIIASNNDWAAAADNGAAVQATGLAPTDFHESAILITLTPGPYTTIVTGSGATNGVAIVEVLAR